jgi:type I restriction enzyme S subunit
MRKGWEVKKLDNIIESNVIGLTKNSREQEIYHKFKYVKMNNITKDNRFDLSKYTCVNANKDELAKYSLTDGDFLFNTRNSYELVGKTCLYKTNLNEIVLYNNNIMRIRFIKTINPTFINYSFCSKEVIKRLDKLKSGTTNVSAIYYKDLKNLELHIPPLEEQQRIVAILDEAFEAIDKAKANTEQNLKNAKELFESELQRVFSQKGKDWEEKTLGDVFEIGSSKRVLKSQWKTEGVPFYRGREITRLAINGYVNNDLYISETHYQELLKKYGVPKPGDIVITAIGTIGNLHIVRKDDKFYFKDASVLWMKRITNVNSEFIKFWLKSAIFFNQLDKDNGATVDTLTIKKLQSLNILIPNFKEQQDIVTKLNTLQEQTKKLEAVYTQKSQDLEELKKSLLQKAFSGELTDKSVEV